MARRRTKTDSGVDSFFGNFVESATAAGPTSCDPAGRHPASANSAMSLHRFDGVVRATGLEPTMAAKEGRADPLVDPEQEN